MVWWLTASSRCFAWSGYKEWCEQEKKTRELKPTIGTGSPIFVNLRPPAFLHFLFHLRSPLGVPNFQLDTLPRTENLALYVETTAFLGIVHVEKLLEPLRYTLQVCFAGHRGLDVQDSACLVECEARRSHVVRGGATLSSTGGFPGVRVL